MASFDVLVCSSSVLGAPVLAGSTPVTCSTTLGGSGNVYSVSLGLPEPYSVYGLPNLSPAEVTPIVLGIGGIWALAFIIRRAMAIM